LSYGALFEVTPLSFVADDNEEEEEEEEGGWGIVGWETK